MHANGICAGYSLISAAIVAMPRPSTMSRAWTFFLLDQVISSLPFPPFTLILTSFHFIPPESPPHVKELRTQSQQEGCLKSEFICVGAVANLHNSGCWLGVNGSSVPGGEGERLHTLELSLWVFWQVLSQGHGIGRHHLPSCGLLCAAFTHLLLQALQQV